MAIPGGVPAIWSLCPILTVIVEPWSEPTSIEQILDQRLFKVASDNKKRLSVTALLAWQPELPQASPAPEDASEVSTLASPTPKKKAIKKAIKKEITKKEDKVAEKRPISAGSAERNTSAKRLPIGQPNVRTHARNGTFIKREAQIKKEAIDNVGNDEEHLPELAEILENAGKKYSRRRGSSPRLLVWA
jgi:hypothetical protein